MNVREFRSQLRECLDLADKGEVISILRMGKVYELKLVHRSGEDLPEGVIGILARKMRADALERKKTELRYKTCKNGHLYRGSRCTNKDCLV